MYMHNWGEIMVNIDNLKIGSIVWYRNNGGQNMRVKIDDIDEGGKNGRPVFSGVVLNPNTDQKCAWGYLTQITRIE